MTNNLHIFLDKDINKELIKTTTKKIKRNEEMKIIEG